MAKEVKFKTDAFRMSKDFLSTGLFSDVLLSKERGGITIIAVVDGKIRITWRRRHFNKFTTQEQVNSFIEEFIQYIKDKY